MQISVQNQSSYPKLLANQISGLVPVLLSAQSSFDLDVPQFLAYARQLSRLCSIKREVDGKCRLTIVVDGVAAEPTVDQILEGMRAGQLGAEAKKLVTDYDLETPLN